MGAVLDINEEQFLFDNESLDPPQGEGGGDRWRTPTFTITFAIAPEKGAEDLITCV